MIPGEMRIAAGDIELNAGRATVTLAVTNSGDRPAQVGSHFHFFETNEARADGELLVCEPATVLPMAQRDFLF